MKVISDSPNVIGNHVFVSYSRDDRKWLVRLLRTLAPLIREGDIQVFSDKSIKPGADWMRDIKTALGNARIAILLISASFLNSDFIMSQELPVLIARADSGDLTLMPVIVGASLFESISSLAKYNAANSPDRPLEAMRRAEWERALVELSYEVKRIAG